MIEVSVSQSRDSKLDHSQRHDTAMVPRLTAILVITNETETILFDWIKYSVCFMFLTEFTPLLNSYPFPHVVPPF